jgi:hypothetical protein
LYQDGISHVPDWYRYAGSHVHARTTVARVVSPRLVP